MTLTGPTGLCDEPIRDASFRIPEETLLSKIMKTCMRNQFILPMLVPIMCSVLVCQLSAQTLTILHSFGAPTMGGINSDGINPRAGLILSGGTVYGTTLVGGSFGDGTLFKVNTNGTGFAALHIFSALDFSGIGTPNSDGAFPRAPLVVSGGTLYGTARHGPSGWGTVFAIDTDATGFTNVYNFTGGSDGAQPDSGLILSGKVLYGTAYSGGNGYGTVFALSTDGASFTTLYNFTGGNDGANPNGRLVLSGSTLYGTTSSGGSSGSGTVFAVDRNGSNFTNLYSFTATDQTYHTNSDGVGPGGSLI